MGTLRLKRLVALVAVAAATSALPALADQQLQQKVAQIKAALAANKQALAQYTWQMQQTVSVNGDVKKQDLYQIVMGPNGQQKTLINQTGSSGPNRQFGIRHRMTQDYENYAKQIASLAESYAQPDPGKLQQLYQQGNVLMGPAGAPGYTNVVISNYQKPGDKVTIVFNGAQNALVSIKIATYLSSPSDAVTIAVQYARLPEGVNYVQNVTVNGASKNMTVQQVSSNLQMRQ